MSCFTCNDFFFLLRKLNPSLISSAYQEKEIHSNTFCFGAHDFWVFSLLIKQYTYVLTEKHSWTCGYWSNNRSIKKVQNKILYLHRQWVRWRPMMMIPIHVFDRVSFISIKPEFLVVLKNSAKMMMLFSSPNYFVCWPRESGGSGVRREKSIYTPPPQHTFSNVHVDRTV